MARCILTERGKSKCGSSSRLSSLLLEVDEQVHAANCMRRGRRHLVCGNTCKERLMNVKLLLITRLMATSNLVSHLAFQLSEEF